MDSKQCTKCKQTKPLHFFRLKKEGWYDSWCRPCYNARAAKLRQERGPLIRSRKHDYERQRRAEREVFIMNYLKAHPCVDCKEPDIRVLEFDHVRGVKHETISRMIMAGYCEATILAEIAKCDVVCANCHKRRTAITQHWQRANWR